MTTYLKQLQNAGPLLNIHQTSRLVWLGSGKICMALSVEFIYLAAHLARQWMKERNCMRIKCLVHIFSGSLGSAVDKRTRNNCMRVKCKVRIFSGSLGSKRNCRY